ncbi:hypothetical protein PFISCL1PPCAC_21549, partial [Pristionchus fissidentatus]
LIDRKIVKINEAIFMAEYSKGIANLSTSWSVVKSTIAMSRRLSALDDVKLMGKMNEEPVLKLSYSGSVINHIANFGNSIVTNLIDKDGIIKEVKTQATPIVASKKSTQNSSDKHQFDRFHTMLLSHNRKIIPTNDPSMSSIGLMTAPMVITPSDSLRMVEVDSGDPSDPAPRYLMISTQKGLADPSAAAAAKSVTRVKKGASILGRKGVNNRLATSSATEDRSNDQPSPSSPKRI